MVKRGASSLLDARLLTTPSAGSSTERNRRSLTRNQTQTGRNARLWIRVPQELHMKGRMLRPGGNRPVPQAPAASSRSHCLVECRIPMLDCPGASAKLVEHCVRGVFPGPTNNQEHDLTNAPGRSRSAPGRCPMPRLVPFGGAKRKWTRARGAYAADLLSCNALREKHKTNQLRLQ